MRKKLTAIGVLSALALGAGTLFGGGSASAGPFGPIQNFNVNNSICYGSAPAIGAMTCPGTSATIAPSSSSLPTYQVTNLPKGSRLTLPIIYTPSSFGFTPGGVGATVGNVTSQTDLQCDGTLDVLSGGPDTTTAWNSWDAVANTSGFGDPIGPSGSEANAALWPDSAVWKPYPFIHQGTAPVGFDPPGPVGPQDAYVGIIKPQPSTFTPLSHDKADLFTLWLNKTGGLFLPIISNGLPTPLNTVTETSPYTAGLRTSVTLLAGNPSPPSDSFSTCLDSPQDSVAENTQITTPSTTGLHARWTIYTSAMDERGGNVSRIIDVSCLQVNGPLTDTDDDCIEGGGPADPVGADSDGDFIVDGVEAAYGTLPGSPDSDSDGATDLEEMAYFTRPSTTSLGFVVDCPGPSTWDSAKDTDCDGQRDKQDNGTDENGLGTAGLGDTDIDDNCPADANPLQENADSDNDFGNGPLSDSTNPSADVLGDACDADDDNDRMSDVAEGGLYILAGASPLLGGHCKPSSVAAGGALLTPTSTTNPDTDFDLGLDGAECKFQTNPLDFASRLTGTVMNYPGGLVSDSGIESFYKTQKINLPSPATGQGDDLDRDGGVTPGSDPHAGNPNRCDTPTSPNCTGANDGDSDNDGLQDGAEVKYYGTHPANDDSDNDGCKDGVEAGDVNGNRQVNATDLSQVSQRIQTGYLPANDALAIPIGRTNYDYTRDRNVNATDLSQISQRFTGTVANPHCLAAVGLIVVPGPQSAAPLP